MISTVPGAAPKSINVSIGYSALSLRMILEFAIFIGKCCARTSEQLGFELYAWALS
jgi:hypothetical protein